SQASNPPSAADLATATDPTNPAYGSKCRLNGLPYPAYTEPSTLYTTPAIAAGYNYPNVVNVATGSATACANANQYCIFNVRGNVLGNPYYYRVQVQYCSNKDGAGFGVAPCQPLY